MNKLYIARGKETYLEDGEDKNGYQRRGRRRLTLKVVYFSSASTNEASEWPRKLANCYCARLGECLYT